jgi:diaminopimelate decarboxylase
METPYFLLKEELLSQNITGFQDALREIWPNSILAYSVKTNSLPWVLRWMDAHGVYAEVVSDEEYDLARLSGYPEDRLVFNGPIKGLENVKSALRLGGIVNIDSEKELRYLSSKKPECRGMLGIRVNVDPALFSEKDVGYQEDGFRFGFSEENGELARALETLGEAYETRSFGLHLHVNSVTRSVEVYRAIARFAAALVQKYKLTPSFVDIGGGFFGGVPGKATPKEYLEAIRSELVPAVDPLDTKLILEPGSAAVGSCFELHTTVLDVKDTARARIVTTDGSRIHIDPLWIKKRYLYSLETEGKLFPRQVICGYTCMDHDRLMTLENEPELSPGDRIVYERVGNYTVTFGGPFIRYLPPVYVKIGGQTRLIRREMKVEDYYRLEFVE